MSDDEPKPPSFRQAIAALADALPVDEAAEREVDRMLAKHHAENPPRKMIAASKLDEANAEIERLKRRIADFDTDIVVHMSAVQERYETQLKTWKANHDQRKAERDALREHLNGTRADHAAEVARLTKERDEALELFRESEHRWNFAGKKLNALTDSVAGLYSSALDSARVEIERLTKDLREFESLAQERGIARMHLQGEVARLTKERDDARANARILAHAYENDCRPLPRAVKESLAYPVVPEPVTLIPSRTHDVDYTEALLADKEHDDYDWVHLDWYDQPLRSIALVPRNDLGRDEDLLEVRTFGWQDKYEYQHVRFEREDLQAMLDYIDGKPVLDFQDESKARDK